MDTAEVNRLKRAISLRTNAVRYGRLMIVASLFASFVGLAVAPNAIWVSYMLFVSAALLILVAFVVSRIPFSLKSENR